MAVKEDRHMPTWKSETVVRPLFPVRGVSPMPAERAGAGADAALHAHLDPFALFDIRLDFLQEAAAILLDHRLIQITHKGSPVFGNS